jgi:hypothetical protein
VKTSDLHEALSTGVVMDQQKRDGVIIACSLYETSLKNIDYWMCRTGAKSVAAFILAAINFDLKDEVSNPLTPIQAQDDPHSFKNPKAVLIFDTASYGIIQKRFRQCRENSSHDYALTCVAIYKKALELDMRPVLEVNLQFRAVFLPN